MNCNHIKDKLTAWADHELTGPATEEVARHLAHCPDCQKEARAVERLHRALDLLDPIPAPRGFAGRVCRSVRPRMEYPDFAQWWRHLTFAWRGIVCGTALAGLVCGAALGTTLTTTVDDGAQSLPYLAVADSGGLYQ